MTIIMKKYINRFLLSGLLIGAALATTSCGEDYLETKPTESISDVSAIATVDNAYKALNGVAKTMTIQHGNYSQGSGASWISSCPPCPWRRMRTSCAG